MFSKILKIFGVFLVSFAIILVAFFFTVQYFGGKIVLNFVNNDLPKIINKKVAIKDAKISFLTGGISLDNLGLIGLPMVSKDIMLVADKLNVNVDVVQLMQKKLVIKNIQLVAPKIHVNFTGNNMIEKSSETIVYMPEISVRNMQVKNGTVVLNLLASNTFYVIENVNINIENPFVIGGNNKSLVNVEISGKIASQEKSLTRINLNFNSFSPKLNFTGSFELKNVDASYIYSFFNPGEDTSVDGGKIDIRSTLHCADDWLTASNVVSIDRLDVRTNEKKLFGIQTDMVTEFFKNNNVTFDLPVNGNIHSLRFDFSAAVTQVLMKALQERLKDESFRIKISEKMGRKIGGKLGENLTEVLYKKK